MGLDGGVRVDHDGVGDGTVPVCHGLYKAEGLRQVDEAVDGRLDLMPLHDPSSMVLDAVALKCVILVHLFRCIFPDFKSSEIKVIMLPKP